MPDRVRLPRRQQIAPFAQISVNVRNRAQIGHADLRLFIALGAPAPWPALRVLAAVLAAAHEGFELLAVAGAAQLVDMFGEIALGFGELAALFLEAREFAFAPFVEGDIAGRTHEGGTAPARRTLPGDAADGFLHPRALLLSEGEEIAFIALAPLPKLAEQDRETERPEDEKAENHRRDLIGPPGHSPAMTPGRSALPR